MKKLVIQMEKQKLAYEQAAIAALQRATQDKAEADSRSAMLEVLALISRKSLFLFFVLTRSLLINLHVCVHQEILASTAAEAEKWRSLYEDLEQKSVQLSKNQNLKEDQLQRLQSQVEVPQSPSSDLRLTVSDLQLLIYSNTCVLCSCPKPGRRG